MKLPSFRLCLLAILLQTIFESLSLDSNASLSSTERGSAKPKPAVGKAVKKRKLPSTDKKSPVTKNKRAGKRRNAKEVVAKKGSNPTLSGLLPKALVELVIAYFSNEKYSILVSTHSWPFEDKPKIAVDSTRVYVITK